MVGKILELWEKVPAWIRWPFILIVGPNLTVFAVVFYVMIVPWHQKSVRAMILTYEEKRDMQIEHILEVQNLQNRQMMDGIARLENQNQKIIDALIKK